MCSKLYMAQYCMYYTLNMVQYLMHLTLYMTLQSMYCILYMSQYSMYYTLNMVQYYRLHSALCLINYILCIAIIDLNTIIAHDTVRHTFSAHFHILTGYSISLPYLCTITAVCRECYILIYTRVGQ